MLATCQHQAALLHRERRAGCYTWKKVEGMISVLDWRLLITEFRLCLGQSSHFYYLRVTQNIMRVRRVFFLEQKDSPAEQIWRGRERPPKKEK